MKKIVNNIIKINSSTIDIIIVFLVCFIPKFIIAVNSVMIYTISDEVSSISVAAFLAGYDWSDVVSNAGYYGIGYLFIFFPLFKLGIAPLIIYRIILSVNAILIGLTAIICYFILDHYFDIDDRFAKVIIACTCGSMSIFSTSITRARNEDIYLLCGWLFAYVLLKVLDDMEVKKIKYEILLAILSLYMLTVHSRAITYIIAFIIICVVCKLLFKKTIVTKYYWVILLIGFGVIEGLLKIYQQLIWQSGSVRNASVGGAVSSAVSKITIDFTMVKSMLMIILGQLFTAFSLSGGIFLIAIVIFMIYIQQCLKNIRKIQSEEFNLFVLGSLYALMIAITICGQCITWGIKVYQGILSESMDYIYAYKAFTYMRYMGSYVPIFIMIMLTIVWKNWKIWKKTCWWTLIIFIGLFLYWYYRIIPYVKDTKSNMEFFISIISLPQEIDNNIDTWYVMFIILFTIILVWMFCNSKKNLLINLLIFGVLFTGYERMEIFYNKVLITENKTLERVDDSCNIIQKLHDKIVENDTDICIVDASNNTDHETWYIYQFMNYDIHIIPGFLDNIPNTDIIFSNKKIDDLLNNYKCFVLDKNEYLYSKSKSYNEIVRLLGYEESVK
mgnify:CR=1 FL=1